MARDETIFPSASYSANQTKVITIAEKYEAAEVVVDITAGLPNLVVTLGGKDATSGKTYTILTSSILTSGTTALRIGPELTAGTNVAKDYVPYELSVAVTQSGGVA